MLFHYTPTSDQVDTAIAATYAMIAAESFGLGRCMLGTPVALNQDPRLKQKYGIPKENKIGLGLLFGYPATDFRHGIRRQLCSVRFS
jgi:nitroreductase